MKDCDAPPLKRSDTLRAASLALVERSSRARERSHELKQRSRMLAERRRVALGTP
ncbi:hypothetical protein [Sphingomonas xinjiangensis]|uniref:Uncharacterized protein n=1 Tax=Sphingomonas xinjiangensis TaxID=643568 RepID=A0A840YQE0_9SPHN|nr:hypothetical protein [Sphingomonas xinjiangensis]MBB5710802.1 hypothetical protein [Sphingomonas xinjiangensis]